MELQLRLHRISAQRIEALDHRSGQSILPDSSLQLGELGLQATWISLIHRLIDAPPSVEWIVVLEDDVLLYRRFRLRADQALRQAPPECSFVQLAHLTPRSWHRSRRFRRNVKVQIEYALARLRELTTRTDDQNSQEQDQLFDTDVAWGAHITAIRVRDLPWMLELLESADLVTDRAFQRAAQQHPGRSLRYRGQLGCQVPFASDLQPARELQRLRRRLARS